MQEFAAPKPGSLIALVLFFSLACSSLAVAQEGDAAAVVAFADGVRAFNEGRNEDAQERFRYVVYEFQPRNATARYWLGLTLLRLGKPSEALIEIETSLRKTATLQVDLFWARHDLGGVQLAAGFPAAAERTLAAVARGVTARLERERSDEPRLRRILEQALKDEEAVLTLLGEPERPDEVRGKAAGARPIGEEPEPSGSPAVRLLARHLKRAESRLAAVRTSKEKPSSDLTKLADEFDELASEAEARLKEKQSDEILLARTLLWQGEALERLGRAEEVIALRSRAAALAPELREPGIVSPPWGGALPSLGQSLRSWDASIGLTTLGDSNPSLLSENLSIDTPDTGTDLVHGGESDEAAQLDLKLSLPPNRNLGGWSLGAAFDGRQSFYRNHDFFNVSELQAIGYLVRGGAPLGYLIGPLGPVRVIRDGERRFSLLFQGGIDHTMLDGRGYVTTAEGSASVVYRPSRRWAGQVDVQLLDRSYRQEPVVGRRSGTEVRLGFSQTWFLGIPERSLRLEVLGGQRSAGLPFESSLLRGTADLSLPLPSRAFTLSLWGSWQRDDYDHPESDLFFFQYDPFDPRFEPLRQKPNLRVDTTLRAAASLSWSAMSNLQLTSRFAWTDRDSNLVGRFASLDYRRTVLSLGASWLF